MHTELAKQALLMLEHYISFIIAIINDNWPQAEDGEQIAESIVKVFEELIRYIGTSYTVGYVKDEYHSISINYRFTLMYTNTATGEVSTAWLGTLEYMNRVEDAYFIFKWTMVKE
jgi:hypothetical protein